jgi:hypothetical protein
MAVVVRSVRVAGAVAVTTGRVAVTTGKAIAVGRDVVGSGAVASVRGGVMG